MTGSPQYTWWPYVVQRAGWVRWQVARADATRSSAVSPLRPLTRLGRFWFACNARAAAAELWQARVDGQSMPRDRAA
jgi:hypothetical protein